MAWGGSSFRRKKHSKKIHFYQLDPYQKAEKRLRWIPVLVLGYRSSDPEHITAILGQTVHFNCHANFPNDEVVPYVVQWEKRGR